MDGRRIFKGMAGNPPPDPMSRTRSARPWGRTRSPARLGMT
jgi:hypothetical protein